MPADVCVFIVKFRGLQHPIQRSTDAGRKRLMTETGAHRGGERARMGLRLDEEPCDSNGQLRLRYKRPELAVDERIPRARKAKANGAADPAAPANDAGAKPAKKKAAAKRKAAKDKKAAPPPRTGTDG